MAQVNYTDNGLVFITKSTFSGVSSASVDNCFSADYSQYKIIFDVIGSSASALYMRMRASGSDNSSTNYIRQYAIALSTSVIGARETSQTYWLSAGRADVHGSVAIMEILNPFQTAYTSAFTCMPSLASGASIEQVNVAFGIDVTTSYDGFTIFPYVGGVTLSGTVYVYGFNEG